MKAEHVLYSVLIFSVMFLGGYYSIIDVSSFYNNGVSYASFLSQNNQIELAKNLTAEINQDTTTSDTESLDDFSFAKNAKRAYDRLKSGANMSTLILTSIAENLGIPSYIVIAIVTAITLMVLMSIIYIMIGWWRG